jgi:hypothetical protein
MLIDVGADGVGTNINAGIGWVLAGLFGQDTITGTADPYTHVFTVNHGANQPFYTMVVWQAGATAGTNDYLRLQDCRLASAKFSFKRNEPFVICDVTGSCTRAELISSTGTLSYAEGTFFSNRVIDVEFGTTPDDILLFNSVDLEITRELQVDAGDVLRNSPYVSYIDSLGFKATVTASGFWDTVNLANYYRSKANNYRFHIHCDLGVTPNRVIDFEITNLMLTEDVGYETSEKEIVPITVTGEAKAEVYTAGDYTDEPIIARIQNACSSAYV